MTFQEVHDDGDVIAAAASDMILLVSATTDRA
jgi:hypothetical protein